MKPHVNPHPRPASFNMQVFGCQMNKLDSELVRRALLESGLSETTPDSADVIIFSTCSVRQKAEEKVYGRIDRLVAMKREHPALIIGVMGCMAQKEGERLVRRFPHVDFVVGTRRFGDIPKIVERVAAGDRPIVDVSDTVPAPDPNEFPAAHADGRFQEYVSIMRGCSNFCSYCIVPSVRGPEKSRSFHEIEKEIRGLRARGVREVTLLGQNVNSYGIDFAGRPVLDELLRRVHDIEGILRIRFVTSHPKDVTESLIKTMAKLPRVMPYLHCPAQAGSDAVLKRMNRGYTRARYLDMLAMAREILPGLAVSGDFIVGFPGETEADFELTVDLMERVCYRSAFVFKYSPRPGTAAAAFDDDVLLAAKKERNRRLLEIQERIQSGQNSALIGKTLEVLIEGVSKRDKNRLTGRAPDNSIVCLDGAPDDLTGRIIPVTIESATALTLFGSPAP